MNLESIGGMEPDVIFQQGIKVLQQKVAALIGELSPSGPAADGGDGFDGGRTPAGMPQGGATPYGGGAASAWGGGMTPYGNGGTRTQYGGAGSNSPSYAGGW
jgi:DNA-directed RNA polymerase II subunit RPB3